MSPGDKSPILPFTIQFPDEKIAHLQAQIQNATIPNNLDDADTAAGLRIADFKSILEYWQTKYSWADEQNALNQLCQFHTDIQGVDLHFIHQRSRHENATPIIMLHGWPSTPFEFRQIIPELTKQERPEEAFHVVAPSLPGFSFSTTQPGLDYTKVTDIFLELMQRLGYDQYIVYGADLGNVVASMMVSKDAGQHCIGLHLQGSIAIPRFSIWSPVRSIKNLFSMLSSSPYEQLKKRTQLRNYMQESTYLFEHCTKARALGLALAQSPIAVGVWIVEKYVAWTDSTGIVIEGAVTENERLKLIADKLDISRTRLDNCRISLDEILTTITLFWLTESLPTSIVFYRSSLWRNPWAIYTKTEVPEVPVALSEFICDITWSPSSWARQQYRNLVQHKFHDQGGHFPALEQPQAVVCDILEFKRRLYPTSSCNLISKHAWVTL